MQTSSKKGFLAASNAIYFCGRSNTWHGPTLNNPSSSLGHMHTHLVLFFKDYSTRICLPAFPSVVVLAIMVAISNSDQATEGKIMFLHFLFISLWGIFRLVFGVMWIPCHLLYTHKKSSQKYKSFYSQRICVRVPVRAVCSTHTYPHNFHLITDTVHWI